MSSSRIDASALRDVCSHLTTGVCVVTSHGPEGPSGMTANAVISLSLDPPLMIVCFNRAARTLAALRHSGRFGIHFLGHHQEKTAACFASKHPEHEKFASVDWSERSGVPSLDDCLAGLACKLRELLPGGDHVIAVGEVVDLWASGGKPLVFFRGDYWSLGNREQAPPEVDEALEGPASAQERHPRPGEAG